MLRKSLILFALLTLVGAAAWAKPPVYFSFASDDYHEGPTFSGYRDAISAKARVDLMVDQQGDFEGGVMIFPSWFNLEGKVYDYKVIPWGANFLHIWNVTGSFSFTHYDTAFGSFLLGTKFKQALLTSLSPSATQAGETMTLQDSWPADSNVVYTDGGPLEAALNFVYPDDYVGIGSGFAFTFTHVRVGDFVGAPPNISDGLFKDEFKSEGSYSGKGGADL